MIDVADHVALKFKRFGKAQRHLAAAHARIQRVDPARQPPGIRRTLQHVQIELVDELRVVQVPIGVL